MMNGVIQVGYMSAKTKPHPNLYGCYPPHLTSNAYSHSWSRYLSGGGVVALYNTFLIVFLKLYSISIRCTQGRFDRTVGQFEISLYFYVDEVNFDGACYHFFPLEKRRCDLWALSGSVL